MKKSAQKIVRRTRGRGTADLLANDTLAGLSGSNLSITGVSGFTHGSGFLDGNGFVHYTPDANYYGAANDEFCFERRAA